MAGSTNSLRLELIVRVCEGEGSRGGVAIKWFSSVVAMKQVWEEGDALLPIHLLLSSSFACFSADTYILYRRRRSHTPKATNDFHWLRLVPSRWKRVQKFR